MSSLVNKVKEVLHSDKNSGKTTQADGTYTQDQSNVAGRTNQQHTGLNTTGPSDGKYATNENYTPATGPATTTAGPHSSNLANKADPRVDSDRDGRAAQGFQGSGNQNFGAYGAAGNAANPRSGATGPASNTAGPHSSNLLNKADPRVDSDASKRYGTTGTSGTHTSGVSHAGNTAHGNTAYGTTGTTGTAGNYDNTGFSNQPPALATTGPASNTAGPHSSNLANKADPRVDSDLDARNAFGTHQAPHQTHGTQAAYGNTPQGTHSNQAFASNDAVATGLSTGPGGTGYSGPASNTAGPHSSNLANKADPRVDSRADGNLLPGSTARPAGATTTGNTGNTHTGYGNVNDGNLLPGSTARPAGATTTGNTHTGYGNVNDGNATAPTGTYGQHNSRLANAADPRIDSDGSKLPGGGATHTHQTRANATGLNNNPVGGVAGTAGTAGAYQASTGNNLTNTGPAPNTAGPHSSDLLNKLDPRVDSNLDGSKTIGGNNRNNY